MKLTYPIIGLLAFFLIGGIIIAQFHVNPTLSAQASLPNDLLTGVTGGQARLTDWSGQVVLLNFWASWCGACREETPDIVQAFAKYHSRGFVAVGVNYGEDRATASQFITSYGVNYPSLLDPDKKLAGQLGVETMPTSFLIDRQGRLHPLPLGQLDFGQVDPLIEKYLTE